MTPDSELLRRYRDLQDQIAFRDWVALRLSLVYSVALRLLHGDAHSAQDVAQQVFTEAARQASQLADHPAISAWLFTSTRFTAAKAVRTQHRRRRREHSAAMDFPRPDPEVDWTPVRPVIDDALASLPAADRDAILLRFFEQADYATIGGRLNLTANAARMRVDRALEKLSAQLRRRGITSTAAALGTVLVKHAVTAVPAGLAATISTTALSAGALATPTVSLFAMLKAPLLTTAAVALTSVTLISQATHQLETRRQSLAVPPPHVTPTIPAHAASASPAVPSVTDADYAALEQQVTALHTRLVALDPPRKPKAPEIPAPLQKAEPLDAAPRPTTRVQPTYPAELRQLGVEGQAVIALTIDKAGNVRAPEAVSATHEAFAQAALEAISSWHFDPGKKGGELVNTRLQIPIVFSLGKKPAAPDEWF